MHHHIASNGCVPVNVNNFVRAESDQYFQKTVRDGGFGKLRHLRTMVPIDQQTVVRMNRDTIYSSGVFDLDAAPLIVTLPDAGKRFMSMMVLSQDHYVSEVAYAPAVRTYSRDGVGTRYVFVAIRTLANPNDPTDMKAANELQDAVTVEQTSAGRFEVPNWDPDSLAKVRGALQTLASLGGLDGLFGTREEVNPIHHLIGAAVGWGGNPKRAAVYESVIPKENNGRTVHTLNIKEVPVDSFWSVSVYNEQGYFEPNDFNAYSVNNLTARSDPDGSITIRFGACQKDTPNCIPIMPGWNYTVRLYRPRKEILDGKWRFPEARPVK